MIYLVCPTLDGALEYAEERGWTRLAFMRFATEAKDDVRVVMRSSNMFPLAGTTRLIKGPGYEDYGSDKEHPSRKWWLPERKAFDEFVESGQGEWIEG